MPKAKPAPPKLDPPAEPIRTPAAEMGTFYAALDLRLIHPSPHNPRKTFDEAELAKLAESIRVKGVLQPVLLRPRKWAEATPFKELDLPSFVSRRLETLLETAVGIGLRSITTVEALLAHLDARGGARGLELRRIGLPDADADQAVEALHTFEEGTKAKLGYELVAGERRVRASKLAGRESIPAVVRDLDDKAAAEASVVENDQRADVPPLEQAHGYRRLLDLGDDAAGIAAKIGRSEDYVLERLQLTKLIPALQEDLARGFITFTHARMLAKIERAEDQAELRERELYDLHPDDVLKGEAPVPNPVHFVRRSIADQFRRDLAGAPWKLDDAGLLPTAGACTACPKRSGSRPGLFDELANGDGRKKADQCFDRTCFDAKKAAVIDLGLRKAAERAGGGEVLRVTTEHYTRERDVLRADQYEVIPAKEAKDAKPGEVKQAVIAEGKRAGQVLTVRVKKQAAPSRKQSGVDYWRKQDAARQKKAEAGKRAAAEAARQVAEKLIKAGVAPDGAMTPKAFALFRELTVSLAGDLGADAARIVGHNRHLPKNPNNNRARVETYAAELPTASECLALIAELAGARKSFLWGSGYGHMGSDDKKFWAAFGIDRAKLEKAAAEAIKAGGKNPAAKPSANGHARPKGKRAKAAAPAGDVGDEDEPAVRKCRKCGCTDADCSGCVARTGEPCRWVEKDLCSACVPEPAWRALPVAELRPRGTILGKLHLTGVATCGQLDDALEAERDIGLTHMDQRDLAQAIAALEQRTPQEAHA